MTALSNDQRFVVVLLLAMASGAWLIAGTTAQTFTSEDRNAIQKFMDVLLNFLDAETDPSNATSTESPTNATTTDPLESTTLAGNSTTTESTTASNSTSDGDSTSESTTLAANATTESISTTTTTAISSSTQISAAPRRICFKRVCYKFAGDRGYIV
ncbi:putative uncharacterized protein YHR219W [Drosophila hydei]|uniref:Uncharacterized protein n=1 Tax=Drosophila hydei TaxID=7224 RepID=A0A6J1LFF7_DROHY|nr:putative uncharacterized protein YHR219W [Drosophila hydei]